MFEKKKVEPKPQKPQEKPIPAFLCNDYSYKAVEEEIMDIGTLEPATVYEIKCHQCEMSIRSQGKNLRSTYERIKNSGCIGCGNKELAIKRIDMSKASKNQANNT